MPLIRRLVLDVLVPHQPNIVDLAQTIASQGEYEVKVTVVEMDDKTQTLVVIIEGADVDFDTVKAAIADFGGSLHSIDEVEVRSLKGSNECRQDKDQTLRLVTADYRRYLARSWAIARRYVVVNGFDGAFTMLGLMTGFHSSGDIALDVVIGASLGAAIALSVSGVTSAYLSESAERRRALAELEAAMITDLSTTAEGRTARVATWVIALTNGAAPLIVSLVIICPLWLANAGVTMPMAPLLVAIATAFACVFGLGTFLGEVGGTFWLTSGLKALLLAAATTGLIVLLEY